MSWAEARSPVALNAGSELWQRILLAVALSTAVAGCGRPDYQLETAPVTGRVTLDGQPLSSGYVMVLPSKGRMAKGSIQPDGTFELGTYESDDGAQVGEHAVIVAPVPRDEGGGGPRNAIPIPRKYSQAQTSGLSIDVKPSGNEDVLFELTTSS